MSTSAMVVPTRHYPAAEIPNLLTSESVTEGHPDKVADFIADSILDAHIAQDGDARVAVEVLLKADRVIVAGEITSAAAVDVDHVVRDAIRQIGYDDSQDPFNADGVRVEHLLSTQSPEIARGVRSGDTQGAGDQGLMVGYATNETAVLMPLPITLAHGITRQLALARHTREVDWLGPDGKAQVSVRYGSGKPIEVSQVVISTQHRAGITRKHIEAWLRDSVLPAALGDWLNRSTQLTVNPSGSFVLGGPSADCGLTGRKIIVDTYGGASRHGGGAFSGKDPSKVDRSAAYFARWVARQLVRQGLADRIEIDVAYAIGRPDPVALHVATHGTGNQRAAEEALRSFNFRPAAIINHLNLRRPIYRRTTNYGHFGKTDLPWEE